MVPARGRPGRPPLGRAEHHRGQSNPTTDSSGTPLWLESDKGTVDAVEDIAAKRGVPMATVALAWVLHNPVVDAPIIGSTKAPHLADAVAALELGLTEDEVVRLEEHYTPRTPTYYGSKSGY